MKKTKQASLSLVVAIFTLISVIAIGSVYLSLERSKQASMASRIADLDNSIKLLNRQNLDLTSRIANLESPNQLKMRLGSLAPISESMVVVQSYNDINNTDSSTSKALALGYESQKIGNLNSVRQ